MSIASFLFGDFDLNEMLEQVQSDVVKLAWHITNENDDLNHLLSLLCKQRNEILATLEDTEEKYHTEVLYGEVAEEKYREVYVKVFRKLIPDSYTNEDDILEGMSANWDIQFPEMSFTVKELISLAECEVGHWKRVRREIARMHADGEL
jgi:hypothetical protein